MAASTVLWNDTLILTLETDSESCALGIDKFTGMNKWRVERELGINWVTAVIADRGTGAELIVQSRTDVTAYDPGTGQMRWVHRAGGLDVIPSPVSDGGAIYVPAGNLIALRPRQGNETPELIWESKKVRASTASPILYQDRLYAVNSVGVLSCADPANGELLWQERVKGPFSASPIAGDDKLYVVNEEGTTTVIDTRSEDRIISTNPLGETILGSPAVSGGRIFMRSDKHLFCIGL